MDFTSQRKLLTQSPLDGKASTLESPPKPGVKHWVPSRYNIRTPAKDGRLVLWNTLRGSMSVFSREQAPQIAEMLKQKGFEAPKRDLVEYLVDRGFLVQKGTNEYRQFQLFFGQQQFRPDVLQLILLSSEDCNFRCKYCYEDFKRGTMHPLVRQGIKKLVTKRMEEGLRSFNIQWFGGEPLYGMEAIDDLGPWFVEMSREHGVSHSSGMTTNGYLLTPEVAEKLIAWNVRHFQITLDGPAEHHNQSRPARDGGETFQTIFNNLKALASRKDDFTVTLRVNFNPSNYPDVPRLMDQVRQDIGADSRFRFDFHAVGRWGGKNDANVEVCGSSGFDIGAQLKAAAHERGLNISTLKEMNLPGNQVCYAARPYNFIIGATGKIMKCTVALDSDERNVVGNILPTGEMVLEADKLSLWTEPAFESDSQCRKCVMLPSCQGMSCPLVRMETQESPCVPTRRYAKRQMLETLKFRTGARIRHITTMTR